MPIYWTTVDIARALHFGADPTSRDARATARKWVERQRTRGVMFPFEIDERTGEKLYASSMSLA
jgi:hypothetical protein